MTAGEADGDRGCPGPRPLTLDAVEDLSELEHSVLAAPGPPAGANDLHGHCRVGRDRHVLLRVLWVEVAGGPTEQTARVRAELLAQDVADDHAGARAASFVHGVAL